jgi:hypothetical chaperone protein
MAQIQLDFLGAALDASIDARRLHDALQVPVAQVVQCAQACVRAAGQTSVDAVYLTGGSSALRPLVDALRLAMPQATLVEGNRFGGVAAGLAHAGAAVGG